jgi:hypothetical protein
MSQASEAQEPLPSWREAPLAWFERWTAKPLTTNHVLAVVIAETKLTGVMNLLGEQFQKTMEARSRLYPQLSWQDMRSESVIAAGVCGSRIRGHMLTGMPAEVAQLPPLTQREFYWKILMLVALLDTQPAIVTSPLDLALMAAECDVALPWLSMEFARRLRREPAGARAAMILSARYLGGDDQRLVPLLHQLAAMAMKHLPVREGSDFEEAAQHIAEVAIRKWGDLHPLTALALALDGKMRIVPKEAANRVMDAHDHERAHRELRVDFVPVVQADINPPEALLARLTSEEEEERQLSRVRTDPRAVNILQALEDLRREGRPDRHKEIAGRLDMTDRTLRRHLEGIRQHLRD